MPDTNAATAVAEQAETLEQKRARLVQVLSRGIVNDQLQRILDKLPSGRVGKFVRTTDSDIALHEAMGFRVEKAKELGVNGLHGSSSGNIVIGDVLLMSCSQEDADLLEEIRAEQRRKTMNRGKEEYKQLVKAAGDKAAPGIYEDPGELEKGE